MICITAYVQIYLHLAEVSKQNCVKYYQQNNLMTNKHNFSYSLKILGIIFDCSLKLLYKLLGRVLWLAKSLRRLNTLGRRMRLGLRLGLSNSLNLLKILLPLLKVGRPSKEIFSSSSKLKETVLCLRLFSPGSCKKFEGVVFVISRW